MTGSDGTEPDSYPEQVVHHPAPRLTGRVVGFGASYTRAIKVGQPFLLAVVATASVARAIVLLLGSVLRAGSGAGTRRRWKDLKKGPEFLVTPLRVRDHLDQLYEVELQGHFPQSALHRGDLVQLTTRAQKDAGLPVRVDHLVNLTTMQLLRPRTATIWSHLGPALLLQAAVGLLLLSGFTAYALA